MKNFIIIVLVIIVAILAVHVYRSKTPGYSQNTSTTTNQNRYMDIQSYIKSDITNLSSIKASLGGTFYVTKVETQNGKGVVEYEDGHNAYTADFKYTVDENGKPNVTSFVVRK